MLGSGGGPGLSYRWVKLLLVCPLVDLRNPRAELVVRRNESRTPPPHREVREGPVTQRHGIWDRPMLVLVYLLCCLMA